MTTVARGMLMALLENAHPQESEHFLRFLSTEEQKLCTAALPAPPLALKSLFSLEHFFQTIHYSWCADPLSSFPVETRTLFLSLFPKAQAAELAQLLEITFEEPIQLSPLAKRLLTHHLKQKVLPKEMLPEPLLPFSEMGALLNLSKDQLVHLIDLLGLHDLAADLRQVVDKVLIQKISESLTKEQIQFLHYCRKQPMRWMPPKLNLAGWDGEKHSLTKLLHQRGLMRFGKALGGEGSSLVWHLCHRLDKGRGGVVMKMFSGKQDLAMIGYFKGQVLHLVKRYQT